MKSCLIYLTFLYVFFYSLSCFAVSVDPIDRELSDMYHVYRGRLSDPAAEMVMAIKPMIEFYDDEAEDLLNSLSMNIRRMYPALKSGDMYVIVYMSIYETLVDEDETYVYPTLDHYNKNITNHEAQIVVFNEVEALMKEYKKMVYSEEYVVDIFEEHDRFANVYSSYNLASGELAAIVEQGKKLKSKHDANLVRRKMLQTALRECLSRLLMDELGI